jgi:hypothetical protein
MKGMASTPDYYVPPKEGPHPATIVAATPGLSKKGNNTQIHIQVQIDGTTDVIDDYLGTDGTVKGAGMSKTKLRGLGVDVSSDAEIPDEVIAANLLGRKCIVEIEHENASKKDEATNTYVNATHFDEKTGQTIQLKRARVKGFRQANVGGFAPPAPGVSQMAPAMAPQQFAAPAAQPPFAQQMAGPPPAQLPPQPQFAAPPFAPPAPVQQQFAGYPAPGTPSAYPGPAPQFAAAPQPPAPAPIQPQFPPAPPAAPSIPLPPGWTAEQWAQQPAQVQQQWAAQFPAPAPAPAPIQQPTLPAPWAPAPGAPVTGYQQPPAIPQPQAAAPVQFTPPPAPQGVPWGNQPVPMQGAPAPEAAPAAEPAKRGPGRPRKVQDATNTQG